MQDRKKTQMYRTEFWTLGEGTGGMIWEKSVETGILSSVKQVASPGWMHETSARGWCTRMTQRDRVGREAGGGSGWGTHINLWMIHVNIWQKPLQYCKVISLQLIKIIGGKNVSLFFLGCRSLGPVFVFWFRHLQDKNTVYLFK